MPKRPPAASDALPNLKWGGHYCHVFGTAEELRYTLVPYFKAGLENNESCLWVTGPQFNAENARSALRAVVPDLDRRELNKQIEIRDAREWYAEGEPIKPREIVASLLQREEAARSQGYVGLRTHGNCSWVQGAQWPGFLEYEQLVQRAMRDRRMVCMCGYSIDQLHQPELANVFECHELVGV